MGVVLRPEDVYRLISCIRFVWKEELAEYSDEVLAIAVDPTQVVQPLMTKVYGRNSSSRGLILVVTRKKTTRFLGGLVESAL